MNLWLFRQNNIFNFDLCEGLLMVKYFQYKEIGNWVTSLFWGFLNLGLVDSHSMSIRKYLRYFDFPMKIVKYGRPGYIKILIKMFLFIKMSLCKFFLNKKTNKKEREIDDGKVNIKAWIQRCPGWGHQR